MQIKDTVSYILKKADEISQRAQSRHIERRDLWAEAAQAKGTLKTYRSLLSFIHRQGGSVSTMGPWYDEDSEILAHDAEDEGYLKIIPHKDGDDHWEITSEGRAYINEPEPPPSLLSRMIADLVSRAKLAISRKRF